VSWSADAGTIGPDGRYVAPGSAPPGGAARIAATSEGGARAEVTIPVREAPPAQPTPGADPGGRGALSRLSLSRRGRFLFAQVTPRRWGRVTVALRARGRRRGVCSERLPAGRTFICRLRHPRGTSIFKLRFRAKLTRGDATLATRRARFDAGAAHAHHHTR
jgi:hypothetical protein